MIYSAQILPLLPRDTGPTGLPGSFRAGTLPVPFYLFLRSLPSLLSLENYTESSILGAMTSDKILLGGLDSNTLCPTGLNASYIRTRLQAPPEMVMKQPVENDMAKQDDRPGVGGRSRCLHVLTGHSPT
jgi:hypothetical protein